MAEWLLGQGLMQPMNTQGNIDPLSEGNWLEMLQGIQRGGKRDRMDYVPQVQGPQVNFGTPMKPRPRPGFAASVAMPQDYFSQLRSGALRLG